MVMENKFSPGRLVCSIAGRDAGNVYIIIDILSNTMVQVVDGKIRKLAAPKKKNIKHLIAYSQKAGEIEEKKNSGQRITDLEVRNILQRLMVETLVKRG
jgi:ribosomal protein L14E/L6E/L27E